MAGDSDRFTAGHFIGGVDGMCLRTREQGGEPRPLHSGLALQTSIVGTRGENGCVDIITALEMFRAWIVRYAEKNSVTAKAMPSQEATIHS